MLKTKDNYGHTPINNASYCGNFEIFDYLENKKINKSNKIYFDRTLD